MQLELTFEERQTIAWMIDIIQEINSHIPQKATFSEKIPDEQMKVMKNILNKVGCVLIGEPYGR